MGTKKEIRPKIWYDYMKWLVKRVHFNKKKYYNLIKMLHDSEFLYDYNIPLDKNRLEDGLYQRHYFFGELGLSMDSDFPYGCSVLEMLVAFSERISSEYVGYSMDDLNGSEVIFCMFLKNLGLFKFDDDHFSAENVKYILHFWMARYYKNDGNGSIFYLKRPVKGFNEEEIWKQMNIFLTQNDIENVDDLVKFL